MIYPEPSDSIILSLNILRKCMFQFTLSLKIQFVFWVQITKSGLLLSNKLTMRKE